MQSLNSKRIGNNALLAGIGNWNTARRYQGVKCPDSPDFRLLPSIGLLSRVHLQTKALQPRLSRGHADGHMPTYYSRFAIDISSFGIHHVTVPMLWVSKAFRSK